MSLEKINNKELFDKITEIRRQFQKENQATFEDERKSHFQYFLLSSILSILVFSLCVYVGVFLD